MPATGFTGQPVSSFAPANALFNPMMAQQQTANEQTIGQNDLEMRARAASALLDPKLYPDEASRAAAYPQVLQELRQSGFGQNAPDTYPGEATLRRVAMMGTPSTKQAEWNYNTGVNQAGLDTGSAGTGTGVGTATATPPPVTGTGTSTTAAQPVEPDALNRAQAVRDGLVKRGLDPDTSVGFSANALHESGANPNVGAGDRGASHGAFQWTGPRYARYIAINGHPPDNAPLDEQLDFLVTELNTTESAARDKIAAAQGPDAKAAAISEFFLRPKDVGPEKERRSATARQLVSQWGGAGQPATTYVGDSLVEPGGVGGQTGQGVRGANPDAVLARLRDPNATSDTQILGRNVVLSSGASNNPEHAQLLASQLQTLKDRGAGAVTVLGVGPGVNGADTVNAQLKEIAERNGARFVALPADQMGKDGIHPTKEGYAALQAQVQAAPAPAATGGGQPPGPYQVAGPVVAPPTGVPGATAATPVNGLAPGTPGAPATAAAVAPVAQNQVGPPVAASPPAPPRLPMLDADNLTADDRRTLAGMVRENPAEFTRTKTAMQARNIAAQHQAFEERRQVTADAAAQAERDYQHARNTGADQRAIDEAGRQAQAARIQQQAEVRAQAKFDQESVAASRPYPGNTPDSADMNILVAGSQPGGDPSSVEYRNAYTRQKYKETSNGNTMTRDMSMFKPPVAPGGGAADVPPTVTSGPGQIFERENKLRDEFQKLTADFRVVQNSYENLHTSAQKPSGAGDMSLLYSYVRLLDPTSVVRESEFATAAASGSFGERVQGAVGRILSGERLPDSLRNDFVREAGNLYKTQLRNHNQMADTYTRLAEDSGVDPKKVVTRFDRPQDDNQTAKVVTIKGDDEFNKLPSGTVFVGPDGKQRVKP